jgi:hypothetical protein
LNIKYGTLRLHTWGSSRTEKNLALNIKNEGHGPICTERRM